MKVIVYEQLDPFLVRVFEDNDLNDHLWFGFMQLLVEELIENIEDESYRIVLNYVKWRYYIHE